MTYLTILLIVILVGQPISSYRLDVQPHLPNMGGADEGWGSAQAGVVGYHTSNPSTITSSNTILSSNIDQAVLYSYDYTDEDDKTNHENKDETFWLDDDLRSTPWLEQRSLIKHTCRGQAEWKHMTKPSCWLEDGIKPQLIHKHTSGDIDEWKNMMTSSYWLEDRIDCMKHSPVLKAVDHTITICYSHTVISNKMNHILYGNREHGIRLLSWNKGNTFLVNSMDDIKQLIDKERPHVLSIQEAAHLIRFKSQTMNSI